MVESSSSGDEDDEWLDKKKDSIGKVTWTGPELVKAGGLYARPQPRQKTEQFEFDAIIDETTKEP